MDCSEFLSRFSEFYDAPQEAPVRKEAEAHLAACGKCARYQEVVTRSVALLHVMPRPELAESFRPRLQHRLFHLDEGGSAARPGKASAIPAATVLGMAILLTAVAWSPMIGGGVPEVELPAIIVSGPPMLEPLVGPNRDDLGIVRRSHDVVTQSRTGRPRPCRRRRTWSLGRSAPAGVRAHRAARSSVWRRCSPAGGRAR